MGGSRRAGLSLSSIWNLATYRVPCNSQYSWSSVRYLTPQSPAGWVRGRGLFKAGSWCREFLRYCGSWIFHPLRSMNDSFGKHCPLPNRRTEGVVGGGGGRRRRGRELGGFKTKMEVLEKLKYIFAGCWVGWQTNTGRTQSSRIKAKYNSKHSLTHTPIKQNKKKIKTQKTKQNGKQAIQSNHTKWHQAFPKWHQVSLFKSHWIPLVLDQFSPSPIILCKPGSTHWLLFMAGQQG